MSYILTDQERAQLTNLRDTGSATEARRAAIILLSADGEQTGAIAGTLGMSTSQVRHWRREWRGRHLDIFPSASESGDESSPTEPEPETASEATGEPGVDLPRRPLELRANIGVEPSDPMAEAGRKVLLFHFERMLLNEPGSRSGVDIEAVHDMRVATRRMRSAMRVFDPYFEPHVIQPFKDSLRRTARLLGVVRDLDVLIEKAQRFDAAHSELSLKPILEMWEFQRQYARDALVAYLDSTDFSKFVRRYDKFLTKPGKGRLPLPDPSEGVAYQVRYLIPALIYERYERVRIFETTLDAPTIDQLHTLRIEFKRFRYTLEFFVDVLDDSARAVIAACKTMQDHLGDLHDAEVADHDLGEFVEEHNAEFSGVPKFMRPDISGVEVYLAAARADKDRLLATFPAAWATFTGPKVRRNLALAVAAL